MDPWSIELWKTDSGICLVERDVLKKMRKRDKFAYRVLEDKFTQYVKFPVEHVMHQKDLEKVKREDSMWELKFHLPRVEIRFLGCLTRQGGPHVFYALYGFRKKTQEIQTNHIKTARERIKEFVSCYTQNEYQKLL